MSSHVFFPFRVTKFRREYSSCPVAKVLFVTDIASIMFANSALSEFGHGFAGEKGKLSRGSREGGLPSGEGTRLEVLDAEVAVGAVVLPAHVGAQHAEAGEDRALGPRWAVLAAVLEQGPVCLAHLVVLKAHLRVRVHRVQSPVQLLEGPGLLHEDHLRSKGAGGQPSCFQTYPKTVDEQKTFWSVGIQAGFAVGRFLIFRLRSERLAVRSVSPYI